VNAFVMSTFASARKALAAARVAQENALLFALDQYAAGPKGHAARRQMLFWHGRRAMYLRQALSERAKAKRLRLTIADTMPPESETRRTA
jgi:hypothetical protein